MSHHAAHSPGSTSGAASAGPSGAPSGAPSGGPVRGAGASEKSVHRHARALRKLAERYQVAPLSCAGAGVLVSGATAEALTRFDVVGFCQEAAQILDGEVDLVRAATATAGRHAADLASTSHTL